MKEKDFRCSNCGRLLFKGDIIIGHIEVKCRCHTMNVFILGINVPKETCGLTPTTIKM